MSLAQGLPSPISLSGERVLVTRAARGIGAATTRALAQLGAHVVGNDMLPMETTAAEVEDFGGSFEPVQGDLTDASFVDRLLDYGPFFSMAHVAAVFEAPSHSDSLRERFHEVMDINVRVSLTLAAAVVDSMSDRGEGYVVLVGSLAGRSGGNVASDSLDYATYAASKGGVHSIVRWLSRRAIQIGVRVNGVAPGGVKTPLSADVHFDPSAFPLGRMGDPDELGWPIALLCTRAAGFTSGAVLDVNGGVWLG